MLAFALLDSEALAVKSFCHVLMIAQAMGSAISKNASVTQAGLATIAQAKWSVPMTAQSEESAAMGSATVILLMVDMHVT